jgi:hypothetical protein
MELENIMLTKVNQVQKTKVECFLSYVEDRSNTNIIILCMCVYRKYF